MADQLVDNNLDYVKKFQNRNMIIHQNSGLVNTFTLGFLYQDFTTGKAYVQTGAENVDITKQGTVTDVTTSQSGMITINNGSTIPSISIAEASPIQDGYMKQAYAGKLDNSSANYSSGNLVLWNSSGANINGTSTNITASLDQVPAPAANVNMNNKQFTSLATASANGNAVEWSQFNGHVGTFNIHVPLDDASSANNRLISAFEVDNRIAASATNIGGRIKAPVQDITALKALDTTSSIDYPDKTSIVVEDNGFYRLDREATDVEDLPRVVAPTVGTGRWFRISSQISDHNNMNQIQGGASSEYYHLSLNTYQATSGTNGTPSSTNKFVTDSDSRMTNSRTPSGSAGGDLGGSYPNPTVTAISFTVPVNRGGTGATTAEVARKNLGCETVVEFDVTASTALQYNLNHALNNLYVTTTILETTSGVVERYFVDKTNTTVNNTRIEFGSDPSGRTFRVVIRGKDLNP